jgi:predicted SAM-dependent methyltransferase
MASLDIGCGSHKMPACIGVDVKPIADVQASIYNLPFRKGFEIVHIREVLEHLERPLEALQETAKIMNPDGVLRITVPNMLSIDCLLRWALFGRLSSSPEHINSWTLPDLIHLVQRAGFHVLGSAFETPERYYRKGHLRYLFSWLPRLGCKSLVLYARR